MNLHHHTSDPLELDPGEAKSLYYQKLIKNKPFLYCQKLIKTLKIIIVKKSVNFVFLRCWQNLDKMKKMALLEATNRQKNPQNYFHLLYFLPIW
jgi:hypothetical protein